MKGKYQKWLTKEGLIKIQGWASDGLTDADISKNMGISCATLYEWKKKYPEISEALKRAKEVADRVVENALYKSACGYEYDEITEERQFNRKTGKYEMVVTKRTRKTVPPNTTAQIFWLKNRKPEVWRDKVENRLELAGESQKKLDDMMHQLGLDE